MFLRGMESTSSQRMVQLGSSYCIFRSGEEPTRVGIFHPEHLFSTNQDGGNQEFSEIAHRPPQSDDESHNPKKKTDGSQFTASAGLFPRSRGARKQSRVSLPSTTVARMQEVTSNEGPTELRDKHVGTEQRTSEEKRPS